MDEGRGGPATRATAAAGDEADETSGVEREGHVRRHDGRDRLGGDESGRPLRDDVADVPDERGRATRMEEHPGWP